MSARWFVADNFKLWYAGDLIPTGIKDINHTAANVKNNGIYTLTGQKISSTTKGINIINGVKVIVK